MNIFIKVYILFSAEVKNILNCIPNHSSIDTKLQFLKQFIPDILKLNPGSLAVVATWTLATVHLLELERKEWPENGLNFAQQVIFIKMNMMNIVTASYLEYLCAYVRYFSL